jgi:hypothetical protein
VNDECVALPGKVVERLSELLKLSERDRSDFVARAAMEREFDHAARNFPRNGFALKSFNHGFSR